MDTQSARKDAMQSLVDNKRLGINLIWVPIHPPKQQKTFAISLVLEAKYDSAIETFPLR